MEKKNAKIKRKRKGLLQKTKRVDEHRRMVIIRTRSATTERKASQMRSKGLGVAGTSGDISKSHFPLSDSTLDSVLDGKPVQA